MDARDILCASVRESRPLLLQQGTTLVTIAMRDTASLVPVPHPIDESSNGEEPLERKRRRLELGKGVAIEADGSGATWTGPVPVFMAYTILSGRSARDERVGLGASLTHSAKGGALSNVGGPHVEAGGSGSDIALEDVNEFLGYHTHMKVKTDGSDRHIIILGGYNLLLNNE